MHRREWPPWRKGERRLEAGAGPPPCSPGQAVCPTVYALALSPADPTVPAAAPGPAPSPVLQPGAQGLHARLTMAPGPAALQPQSLELFQGPEQLPESSVLVLVGLGRIQVCFSNGALPSSFSRNRPSSAPLRRPLPALSKVVTGLGGDRMEHTRGTPSHHHLKSKV